MGQDSEQAAEFVATVRGEHVAMKEWYTSNQSPATQALQATYGPYPSLWKEVLNWPISKSSFYFLKFRFYGPFQRIPRLFYS